MDSLKLNWNIDVTQPDWRYKMHVNKFVLMQCSIGHNGEEKIKMENIKLAEYFEDGLLIIDVDVDGLVTRHEDGSEHYRRMWDSIERRERNINK